MTVYLGCRVTQIPTDASSFPTDRGGLPPSPLPVILRCRVHPLVSFAVLQSSISQSPCPSACAPVRLPWGCVPHHDINTRSPQFAGVPVPTMFRPQRFARSRRLAPPHALRVCFAAQPCPGFLLQGVDSSSLAVPPRGGRYPRAVGAARLPVARRQRTSRRPQGLAPEPESAVSDELVQPAVTRIPSCVFNSRRLFSRDLGRAIARPPLAAFRGPQRIVGP